MGYTLKPINTTDLSDMDLPEDKELLRQELVKYKLIVDNAYDLEAWILHDRTLAYISPSCERITGYSQADFYKNNNLLFEIVHDEDRGKVLAQFEECYNNELSEPDLFRIICKGGAVRWLGAAIKTVTDSKGEVLGYRSSLRDMTRIKELDRELERTKDFYFKIVNNQVDVMYRLKPDGTITFVNLAGEAFFGLGGDKIIGANFRMFFKEDIVNQGLAIVASLSPQEPRKNITYDYVIPDGTNRIFEIDIQGFFNEANELDEIQLIVKDVTEVNKLQKDILNSKMMYEKIVEDQPDFVFRISPEGELLFVNNAMVDVFNLKDVDFLGKNYRLFAEPEEVVRVENMKAKINFEQPLVREVLDYTQHGVKTSYIDWIVRGFFNDDMQLAGYQAIGRDVTQSVEILSKLRLSENRFKAVIDSQNDFIVRYDPNDKIIFINNSLCEFSGLDEIDLLGQDWKKLLIELGPKYLKNSNPQIEFNNKDLFYELEMVRADGESRWIQWQGSILISESDKYSETQVVGHDITELMTTQIQLKDALAQVNLLKEQFEKENKYLKEKYEPTEAEGNIVTQSPLMIEVLNKVKQVGKTDSAVLIAGETGTGKEDIAQAIHNASSRSKKTMITINCASLPPSLIESELFGRERGTFTGVLSSQTGNIQMAHNSTLFMDEVGDLPPDIQLKLLRVMQYGEYQKIGSFETKKVDVRIIVATKKNLANEVQTGSFNEDLFYRLSVFPILVPPLRDRKEDIPNLAWSFIDEIAVTSGKKIEKISSESISRINAYNWPGNSQELRNIIEYSIIMAKGSILDIQVPELKKDGVTSDTLNENQRSHIERMLKLTAWRIRGADGAAERLGMKESTLRYRMKKLGISRPK